jgi:hypothetical protein
MGLDERVGDEPGVDIVISILIDRPPERGSGRNLTAPRNGNISSTTKVNPRHKIQPQK